MDETDEMNEAIRANAMLVSYHTTAWSGRVKDPAAAQAAARALGITTSALSTSKNLMDGADTKLRAVTSAQEAGRQDHARLTLPWTADAGARGPRMLPTAKVLDYLKAMGAAKSAYQTALADFIASYPADAAKAQGRINLVGDPLRLYPPADKIAGYFDLNVDLTPIPASAQFKGLPEGFADEIKNALERRIRTRLDGAMAEAFSRAHAAVRNLGERLSASEPTFKSAAVENVRDLAPMLRAWNVDGDERMEELAENVEKLVNGEDMKSLKANEPVRRIIAKECQRVVKMIEDWEVLPT